MVGNSSKTFAKELIEVYYKQTRRLPFVLLQAGSLCLVCDKSVRQEGNAHDKHRLLGSLHGLTAIYRNNLPRHRFLLQRCTDELRDIFRSCDTLQQ